MSESTSTSSVPCTQCHAVAGEPCTAPDGSRRTHYHLRRMIAAERPR